MLRDTNIRKGQTKYTFKHEKEKIVINLKNNIEFYVKRNALDQIYRFFDLPSLLLCLILLAFANSPSPHSFLRTNLIRYFQLHRWLRNVPQNIHITIRWAPFLSLFLSLTKTSSTCAKISKNEFVVLIKKISSLKFLFSWKYFVFLKFNRYFFLIKLICLVTVR